MAAKIVVTFSLIAAIFAGLLIAQPTTAPSEDHSPATQPAVNPQAQALLDQIGAAYAKLNTLDLAGTITFDADAAGEKQHQTASFTAAFQAPNKFRHEMKDDLTLVGTGEKLFTFIAQRNQYMSADEPQERTTDLPNDLGDLLRQQNPSLWLALSANAVDELSDGAESFQKAADVVVGDKTFPAISFALDAGKATIAIDPASGLIKQFQIDMTEMLKKQQVPQVNKAMIVIDYTQSAPGGAIAAEKFAFTPPPGAQLVKADEIAAGGGNGEDASQELVGKSAPALKLEGIDGKQIAPLDEFKGSVIVLDFWATWCPPCREGLPHLNELYEAKKSDGLKVFAVNLREDKDKAQKFMTDQKLSLPVLLDFNGAVAGDYRVSGIPQTVVIGKDGKIRNVLVGFGEGSAKLLSDAVDAALKEK